MNDSLIGGVMRMQRQFYFLTLAVALISGFGAQAALLTRTDTIVLSPATSSGTLALGRFDDAIGTLKSVEIGLEGSLIGTVTLDNSRNRQRSASPRVTGRLLLDLPNPLANLRLRITDTSGPVTLSALASEDLDFDAAGSRTRGPLEKPRKLAPFIGASDLELPIFAFFTESCRGGRAIDCSFDTQLSVTARVVYDYEPKAVPLPVNGPVAVPEPGSLLLTLAGACAAVAMARRRRVN